MIDQTTYLFNQLANQYLKVNIEQNMIIDPEIHKILHLLQKKVRQPKLKPYQNSQFYYLINHKNSWINLHLHLSIYIQKICRQ
ncbi:unnamed protein product [Paramecium primaurelia]|uniref:Uncharacterized protein n=1 Tax=Paramecium primaurelia TaxID=5886 RepID=A0A8S1PAX9_PARPR|nr:unnamed protein product [Paramecium primaurelia]